MDDFKNLLEINMGNTNTKGMYKAKVCSEVYNANNVKPYILIDISEMKKQYMIYTEEFNEDMPVPTQNEIINVVIVNNDSHPYGIASCIKAIEKGKVDVYHQHRINKTNFIGKVTAKRDNKYELQIENYTLKPILITNKTLEIGSTVKVHIKNISNKVKYMAFTPSLISYTHKISPLQVVKCKIVDVGSLMFYVDIIDDQEKVILKNGESDIVNCVVPFTDLGDKSSFEMKNNYKIGDVFEAQVISISNVKVVLSKSALLHQDLFGVIKQIHKDQVLNAKVVSVDDKGAVLETMFNNINIKCEMLVNEFAWSVAQREHIKNEVIKIGSEIKVQVIGIDMRSCKVQVSYKNINLVNPLIEFKKEINPETNEPWKVGDTITVLPTFDMKLNDKKRFCYLYYNNMDITLDNWQEDEQCAQDILQKKPIQVVISSIPDEDFTGQFKIFVRHKQSFNNIADKLIRKGIYKCLVNKSGKYENFLTPIAYIDNGVEQDIKAEMEAISNKISFILKLNDVPANIKIMEGQVYTCKLVFVDSIKKQVGFSINAYNNDRNKKIERDNTVSNIYKIF